MTSFHLLLSYAMLLFIYLPSQSVHRGRLLRAGALSHRAVKSLPKIGACGGLGDRFSPRMGTPSWAPRPPRAISATE